MIKKEYKKLKNDAQIIFVHDKRLKSINISAVFNVGPKNENDKTAGISHLIEHLICQDKSLNKRLESIGTEIYGNTYKEITNYLFNTLKKDFIKSFDIFIKSLLELNINQNDIKKEKKIISEEIKINQNDYVVLVEDYLEELMFPNSYLGKAMLGSFSSLKKIDINDIKSYYQKYYNPNNLVICLIGDITPDIKNKVIEIVESQKNKTDLLDKEWNKHIPENSDFHLSVKKNKSEQIEAAVGFKGFSLFDQRKYILRLLSIVLTHGYTSRLIKKIREKEGLVYSLESFCEEYIKNGYLEIKFAVSKKNIEKVFKIIGNEIKELSKKKIPEEELAKTKEIFKNEILLNLENPITLSRYLATERILTGENMDIEKEIFRYIDEIESKKMLEISRRIFAKENICISLIGNTSSNRNFYFKFF